MRYGILTIKLLTMQTFCYVTLLTVTDVSKHFNVFVFRVLRQLGLEGEDTTTFGE